MRKAFLLPFAVFCFEPEVFASESYTLERLEALALEGNPSLRAARQDRDIARSDVSTARAIPNPSVEYLTGPMRFRPGIDGVSGNSTSVGVTQPIDMPFIRSPRIAAAKAGQAATEAGYRLYETEWIASLRRAYFDVLRRNAEQANADESLTLMKSVNDKVTLSVGQGETARFELIRTQAELLGVQKTAQAAALRVEQARVQLRQVVGPELPEDFAVTGQLSDPPAPPPLETLVASVIDSNPTLEQARSSAERARYRLQQEQSYRLPGVAFRAERSLDREQQQTRFGVTVTVPLWDQRKGPVSAAEAELSKSQFSLSAAQHAVRQQLSIAYKTYEIAQDQVIALEGGVVSEAQAAVKVAEVAYRSGEGGLMDVLDAQRVYRAARADLIASRFDLALAWVDIQRLSPQLRREAE